MHKLKASIGVLLLLGLQAGGAALLYAEDEPAEGEASNPGAIPQAEEPNKHDDVAHEGQVYSLYLATWTRRIERTAILYYPDAARKLKEVANVVVTAEINKDGSLRSTRIIKSSGNPELDKGTIEIIENAAPFQPLPHSIAKDTDVLAITRAFQFIPKKESTADSH